MTEDWREVGDRVYVRRHRSFDLNVGLVVGDGQCLVVDTRASHREGRDLAEAVRRITGAPWTVVNTHAHFDHVFGNAVFRPAVVWGHVRCAEVIREYGEVQRRATIAHAERANLPEVAEDLALVRIDPPDRTFRDTATVGVGGRSVELRYLGGGHTDNDIVVVVPDAGVVFAGDLVEEGAPPSFHDSLPMDWPVTAGRLLELATGPVVPGHGDVVDRAYVEEQHAALARTAEVARAAFADGGGDDRAWPEVPFPEETARTALQRAFRQLRGEPVYDPPARILAALGLADEPDEPDEPADPPRRS